MHGTASFPPRVIVARLRIERSVALIPCAASGWLAGWALWWLCLPIAAGPTALPQAAKAPVAWEFLSNAASWAAGAVALLILGRVLAPALGKWAASTLPLRSREWFVAQGRARRAPRRFSVTLVIMCLAPWALMALVAPSPVYLVMASRVLAGLGMTVAFLSLAARRGRRLSCRRCGYPMTSWRSATIRCPECGSHWRNPGKIACGRRHTHRPSLAAGMGLLALSVGCLVLFASL